MFENILFSMLILVIGLIMLWADRIVKRNLLFSVFVPDEQLTHPGVTLIRRQFRQRIIISAIAVAVINFVMMLLLSDYRYVTFTVAVNLLILIDIWLYKEAYDHLRSLKARENWMAGKKVIRATDTTVRNHLDILPSWFYIFPVGVMIAAVIFTAVNYGRIPDEIATHWNIHNEPDQWEKKSIFSVFSLAWIGLPIIALMTAANQGILNFPMMLNPSAKDASIKYENDSRRNNSYILFITTLVLSLFLSFALVQPVIFEPDYMPPFIVPLLMAGLLLPTVIGILYQVKAEKAYRRAASQVEKVPYHDEQHYKWGLFYYNKEDANVWVPKPSQFGMTLNMARPEAVFISVLLLVLVLLPLIIALIMG